MSDSLSLQGSIIPEDGLKNKGRTLEKPANEVNRFVAHAPADQARPTLM